MIEIAFIAAAVLLIGALEEYMGRRDRRTRWAAIPSPDDNAERVVAYYARLASRKKHPEDPPFIPRLRRGIRLQTELALTGRITSAT